MAAPPRGKPGKDAEKTRLALLLAVLVLVAVIGLMRLWGGDVLVGAGSKLQETAYSPRKVPVLLSQTAEPAAASDDERDHRNPFTYGPPPTPTPDLTPKPTATPRPTPVPVTPAPTPTCCPPTPRPRPPAFDREYIGHFGPLRLRVAAFRKKPVDPDGIKEIEVAAIGEVLDNKFIVRDIGLESVLIGFVGFDPSEDTRVPLADK
jgi:hypothetical protein